MADVRMIVCPNCGAHLSGTRLRYGDECKNCGYDIYANRKFVHAHTRKLKRVV